MGYVWLAWELGWLGGVVPGVSQWPWEPLQLVLWDPCVVWSNTDGSIQPPVTHFFIQKTLCGVANGCVCCPQSVWCLRAAAMACSSGQSNAETLEGFHEVNLASPTTPDLQVGPVFSLRLSHRSACVRRFILAWAVNRQQCVVSRSVTTEQNNIVTITGSETKTSVVFNYEKMILMLLISSQLIRKTLIRDRLRFCETVCSSWVWKRKKSSFCVSEHWNAKRDKLFFVPIFFTFSILLIFKMVILFYSLV